MKKIRSAPLEVRKKWLITSTILCMVVVIYVWLAYFNSIIGPVDNSSARIVQSEGSFSLWQSLKGVGGLIGEKMMGRASIIGSLFGGSRDFMVNP